MGGVCWPCGGMCSACDWGVDVHALWVVPVCPVGGVFEPPMGVCVYSHVYNMINSSLSRLVGLII